MDENSEPVFTHSWTDEVIDASGDSLYTPAWNNAKKGKTSVYDYRGYWWDKQNKEYDVLYHTIYMPDDPNIAGRNWIEMECMGDKAIVYFTLEYKGDYTNGTGWRMKDVSFENIPSANPEKTSVELRDDGLLSPFAALNNLMIVDGCGWSSDPSETFGKNQNGEEIVYGMNLYFEQSAQEVKLSAVSWMDDIEPKTDVIYDEAWELAKKGITTAYQYYYENEQSDGSIYAVSEVDVVLPDNPAIAGEQWLTLTCDNQRALIRVKLTYLGNYETGKGWKIEHLGTSINQIG